MAQRDFCSCASSWLKICTFSTLVSFECFILKQTVSWFSYHEDTLPRHPAYWQHSSALDPIVVSSIQVSAHAEVCYLDMTLAASILSALTLLPPNQAVARGQVPVHKVERRQELHSRCDLARHGDEGWVAGDKKTDGKLSQNSEYTCGNLFRLYACVHALPDGRCIVWRPTFVQQDSVGQILVQVTTLHVLGDHAEGITAHTHSQQPDDIWVFQARQNLHLFQEVVPTRNTKKHESEMYIPDNNTAGYTEKEDQRIMQIYSSLLPLYNTSWLSQVRWSFT